ncbi:MAG: hypothetical protein AAB597_01980 [Patescibacteria group bacterium]
MSLEEKFLKVIFEPRFRYKGIPVSLIGVPDFLSLKMASTRVAIGRLKKKGYIEYKGGVFIGLQRGKDFLGHKKKGLPLFKSPFPQNSPKNLLVIFDVPENHKFKREWLREQLKRFGYKMIQQSAWIGPSPLPEEFMACLEEQKIRSCIKTFKLAKPYAV